MQAVSHAADTQPDAQLVDHNQRQHRHAPERRHRTFLQRILPDTVQQGFLHARIYFVRTTAARLIIQTVWALCVVTLDSEPHGDAARLKNNGDHWDRLSLDHEQNHMCSLADPTHSKRLSC